MSGTEENIFSSMGRQLNNLLFIEKSYGSSEGRAI